MPSVSTVTQLPRTISHAVLSQGLGLRCGGPWRLHAVRSAVAVVFILSAAGCGHETVAPESDELMIVGGADLFELDSVQLAAAFSGKPTLPPGAVTWSVSGGGFATISRTGLLTAIRATDFDGPAEPPRSPITITAAAGTRTASRTMWIVGWRKPLAPDLDGVAYMSDEWFSPNNYWGSFSGIDQAGESYGGWGRLVLTCGTVVAGKWTVEISPDGLDAPTMDPTRRLFSTDTVLVGFDGEVRKFERWQRVGLRLRAPDSDDLVGRMRRARTLTVIARSYAADPAVTFAFRLGNVENVTSAAAFRACT